MNKTHLNPEGVVPVTTPLKSLVVSPVVRRLLAVVLTLGLATPQIYAISPAEISYQGKLADGAGPVTQNGVSMVFGVYDVESGGSPLYTYARSVDVVNGIFNVNIGAAGGTSVNNLGTAIQGGVNRWLQVTVAGTPLLPRQKLAASPYAITVAADSVTTTEILNGQVGLIDMAADSVDATKVKDGTLTELDMGTINTWTVVNDITSQSGDFVSSNGGLDVNQDIITRSGNISASIGDITAGPGKRFIRGTSQGINVNSPACGSDEVLKGMKIDGGIVTAGTCAADEAGSTLSAANITSGSFPDPTGGLDSVAYTFKNGLNFTGAWTSINYPNGLVFKGGNDVSIEGGDLRASLDLVVNGTIWSETGDVRVSENLNVSGSVTANHFWGPLNDLAEAFPASESLEPGDVVMMDPNPPSHTTVWDQSAIDDKKLARGKKIPMAIQKSRGAYTPTVMGILSTAPGFLLSEAQEGEKYYPVALTGRVPVKVSLENGAIEKGDFLASSSLPGVAMKATQPGLTIGIALEDFTGAKGETGKILCFVQVGERNMAQTVKSLRDQAAALERDNQELRHVMHEVLNRLDTYEAGLSDDQGVDFIPTKLKKNSKNSLKNIDLQRN
jgi:hypothetical protein